MSITATNEHCMELMARYPDKYFDLASVDPPYGIGESAKNHASRNTPILQKNGVLLNAPAPNYTRSAWDNKSPDREYFLELFRVSKHQIIWGINYMVNCPPVGPGRIVWDKVNGESDFSDCEIAYCSLFNSVRLIRYMWSGMMQGKSIEQGHIMQGNKKLNEKRIHPTQKPVLLYKELLKRYAKPGCIVLDTHRGSDSQDIACELMGIDLVCCEIDPDMFEKANNRILEWRSQPQLFNPTAA